MKAKILRFENASGVTLTPEFLKSRKVFNVAIRDFFVNILLEEGYRHEDIAELINKNRSSIYASMDRFEYQISRDPAFCTEYESIRYRYINSLDICLDNTEEPEHDCIQDVKNTIEEFRFYCEIDINDKFLKARDRRTKNERCVVLKIMCEKHDLRLVSKVLGISQSNIHHHLRDFEIKNKKSIEFRSLYEELKI